MLRRALGLVGVVVGVLAIAGPAGAHVTIQPGEAAQGSFATEWFQVPNERDDASTVSVEVTFPEDVPIEHVSVEPVPGWQVQIERRTLDQPIGEGEDATTEVVSKITWSGGAIEPGQFQRFGVSMGALPDDVDSLEFPAVQTYSNGEVVRWIDPVTPGGEEPESPAPTLTLTASSGDEHGGDAAADEAASDDHPATSDDVDSARTIGIIGIVVGALGLILAIVALVRKPRVST